MARTRDWNPPLSRLPFAEVDRLNTKLDTERQKPGRQYPGFHLGSTRDTSTRRPFFGNLVHLAVTVVASTSPTQVAPGQALALRDSFSA